MRNQRRDLRRGILKGLLWIGIAIAVILVLVYFTGCEPDLTEGTVLEKQYDDPDDYFITIEHCQSSGTSVSCYPTLIPVHDGPEWKFKLHYCESTSNCRDDWINVDQTTFDAYEVGDYYER